MWILLFRTPDIRTDSENETANNERHQERKQRTLTQRLLLSRLTDPSLVSGWPLVLAGTAV